jgi:putative DNA primase/helicase
VVLNIAEGVETALAVHCNLGEHDGHVWSVLSAGAMQQFQPPKWCTRLVIWADNDASFTGQQAAYNLAHRLKRDGLDVRVMVPAIVDHDWADWESWV